MMIALEYMPTARYSEGYFSLLILEVGDGSPFLFFRYTNLVAGVLFFKLKLCVPIPDCLCTGIGSQYDEAHHSDMPST